MPGLCNSSLDPRHTWRTVGRSVSVLSTSSSTTTFATETEREMAPNRRRCIHECCLSSVVHLVKELNQIEWPALQKGRCWIQTINGGPVVRCCCVCTEFWIGFFFIKQLSIPDFGHDDVYDIFGDISSRGLSREALEKLPHYMVADQAQAQGKSGEDLSCAICLQVQLS